MKQETNGKNDDEKISSRYTKTKKDKKLLYRKKLKIEYKKRDNDTVSGRQTTTKIEGNKKRIKNVVKVKTIKSNQKTFQPQL